MPHALAPMITFGTNPGMVMPDRRRRCPQLNGDPALRKALDYMQLTPGEPPARQESGRRVHRQLHEWRA